MLDYPLISLNIKEFPVSDIPERPKNSNSKKDLIFGLTMLEFDKRRMKDPAYKLNQENLKACGLHVLSELKAAKAERRKAEMN